MYFHSQDLKKEDYETDTLLHGRCWLNHDLFHVEWCVPSKSWAIQLHLNSLGETAIALRVSLWLFSIYVSTQNRRLYNWLEPKTCRKGKIYSSGRSIGVAFFDGTLWFDLWADMMDYESTDPWWWKFDINLADLFLGKAKYYKNIIKKGGAEIDMPEGIYPANFEIARQTWKRPRWFKKVVESVWFDLPVGIPAYGKGESSWNCGIQATTGIGFPWRGNIHQATKGVAMRLLQDRQMCGSLSDPAYGKWRRKGIKAQIKSLEQLTNSQKEDE